MLFDAADLVRWLSGKRHSRHLTSFGATSKHGPFCRNASQVFFSCVWDGVLKGFRLAVMRIFFLVSKKKTII